MIGTKVALNPHRMPINGNKDSVYTIIAQQLLIDRRVDSAREEKLYTIRDIETQDLVLVADDSIIPLPDSETQAQWFATGRMRLYKRLLETKAVLTPIVKARFGKMRFSFPDRALYGDGVRLQWMLREKPSLPISYENQQTTQGIVMVLWDE